MKMPLACRTGHERPELLKLLMTSSGSPVAMVTPWLAAQLQPRCLSRPSCPYIRPRVASRVANRVLVFCTRCCMAAPNMMTFHLNASRPAAEGLTSEGGSGCSPCGPDAAKYLAYRSSGMRAAAAAGQCNNTRRKLPALQPVSKPRDWSSLVSGFIVGGSHNLASEVRLEPENNDLNKDICGRHLLFDKQCARLERTRTVIPQLSRNYHVHRPGNLHPFSLSKELSHSHSGRPFTLGYRKRYELNTTPAVLLPSTLVLNGRNTFTVENCKLSRPTVKYPSTCNLLNVKDHQKSQSYPDPVVGASRSFIHRVSELSSLEGDTVRQEKLKKMRKPKKTPS